MWTDGNDSDALSDRMMTLYCWLVLQSDIHHCLSPRISRLASALISSLSINRHLYADDTCSLSSWFTSSSTDHLVTVCLHSRYPSELQCVQQSMDIDSLKKRVHFTPSCRDWSTIMRSLLGGSQGCKQDLFFRDRYEIETFESLFETRPRPFETQIETFFEMVCYWTTCTGFIKLSKYCTVIWHDTIVYCALKVKGIEPPIAKAQQPNMLRG